MDFIATGHHADPAAGIFKLSDIAWPVEVTQIVQGVRFECLDRHPLFSRGACQKVVEQNGNVFSSLCQCRQLNADNI